MTDYEPIIGLEVHAELLTASKMFCACPVVDSTSAPPNTTVCAVCTAQPGVLPVINRQAVDYAIRVGLALNCTINEYNQFARKSYFYPDLPKGYQISQYEHPLASNGWVDIETGGDVRRIGIRRAHMEEDTGKLFHVGDSSLVDLNRAGVPLLEIVSEPDLKTLDEVEAYARKLRAILVYLGVNHGDMSKGVLRFEANISVRPAGSDALNTRTEIKNLNSIRSLVRACRHEIERQIKIVSQGGEVVQHTMGFNEETGQTYSQRSKEEAHDYRYFPEPDLPPLHISEEWVEEVERTLPELPDARRDRFMANYHLARNFADILVSEKPIADYFEEAAKTGIVLPDKSTKDFFQSATEKGEELGISPKLIAIWMTGELYRLMNETGIEIGAVKIKPTDLVRLIALVEAGTINNNTAKDVLGVMFETGREAEEIVRERGLAQISDTAALAAAVEKVLAANPQQVQSYLGGKEGLYGWLVGQVMRETAGKANTALVNEMLRTKLEEMKK